jgi:hypothetical protein
MGLPDGGVTVEVEFTAGVWTDVTSYVLPGGVTFRRGRSNEADTIQPGTISFALWNTTGRFTPSNPGSPYYPNVLVNKRVRVSAVHSAVTYRRFVGYVDAWVERFGDGAVVPVVEVTATDYLKILARKTFQRGAIENATANGLTHLWLLDEPSGRAFTDYADPNGPALTLAPGRDGTVAVAYEVATTLTDYPAAVTMDRNASNTAIGYAAYADIGNVSITSGFRVEVAFKTSRVPASGTTVLFEAAYSATQYVLVGLNSSGQLVLNGFAAADTTSVAGGYNDDAWHHILVQYNGSTTTTLYAHGSSVATSTASSPPSTVSRVMVGGRVPVGTSKAVNIQGGTFAFFGFSTGTVTGTVINNQADEVLRGPTQSESVQLMTIADLMAEWSGTTITDTAMHDPYVEFDAVSIDGKSALQALTELADTEGGVIAAARDGSGLIFRGRLYPDSHTTPALTVNASTSLLGDAMELTLDDRVLVNDCTVTFTSGEAGRAVDQSSIDAYGRYATTFESLTYPQGDIQNTWRSYDAAKYEAQARVAAGSEPGVRCPRITLDPYRSTISYATLFGLDVLDRIRVTNLPTTAPHDTIDYVIQGFTETITPDSYTVVLDTSPVDAPAFVVFSDTTYGRFGGSSTLDSNMTAGATSFATTTADESKRWSTLDEPYDITVNGERMTVTATSESGTGPWTATFTVTRTRGVAHTAGDTIELHPVLTFGW